MELLSFCTILAIFIKAETFSLLTDSEDQNSTTMEYSRREIKDMDVLRQIINQETIIRLALTKTVRALLNDVQSMKRTMVSNEAVVSRLQQTIATLTIRMDTLHHNHITLQQEHQNLKNNSKKCHGMIEEFEQQFKTVDQNITTINENQFSITRQNDEKRERIAKKTNKVVGDIKTEIRNLSVTLLDLKEKIEKENRINDEKSNEIESRWNTSIGHLKVEHLENRRIFSNLSALIRNLENSQSEMNRTLTGNGLKVAFTAGIKSGDSSWSGSTLVFPLIIYNEGGGYDANTGVFTALSAGTYVFYTSIISAFQKYIILDIVVNGSGKVRVLTYYNSGSAISIHQMGSNLVVLALNKADRVWVRWVGGTGYHSNSIPSMTFSGFRLF